MPETTIEWTPTHLDSLLSARLDAALVVLSLGLAAFGVSNRVWWCQLQAYTVIALFAAGLLLFSRQKARRRHAAVVVRNGVYCTDCAGRSRAVVLAGPLADSQPSVFERLYARPVDWWLSVFLWAAWACYGAIFHEGQHVREEDSLLGAATGSMVGLALPLALRVVRVVVLYFFAIASLLSDTIGGTHAAVAFVLALFPGEKSTPQALTTEELTVRTFVFVSLFLLSEALERTRSYSMFLATFNESSHWLAVVTKMALGEALPHKIPKSHTEALCFVNTDGSSASRTEAEDNETMRKLHERMRSSLRSAWILIVPAYAYGLAVIQVLLVLVMYWYNWKRARNAVLAKSNSLRSSSEDTTSMSKNTPVLPITNKHAKSTPKPKPRRAETPPPPARSSSGLRSRSKEARRPKRAPRRKKPAAASGPPGSGKARASPAVSESESATSASAPPRTDLQLPEALFRTAKSAEELPKISGLSAAKFLRKQVGSKQD